VPVEPQDTVLFYTDGVTDTIGTDDRFGVERLRAVLARAPAAPEPLLEAIEAALDRFRVGRAPDDIAMLALSPLGERDGDHLADESILVK